MTNSTSTVFIVDDEPNGREVSMGQLAQEGYDLAFLARAPQALARLDESELDVIFLGVMTPDMNGFEVCWRLKAEAHWRHVPVVLVTDLSSKEDVAREL